VNEQWHGGVSDAWDPAPVRESRVVHRGSKWNVVVESVQIGQQLVTRDVVVHPGAVAVVVLNDCDQVYLLRQYRQPLGAYLFETPAGLLDHPTEAPLAAAQRELAEEAGLAARTWHVVSDFLNSPGGSSEAIRIYLARDITELPGGRAHTGEAEEMDLPGVWVDLTTAVQLILAGDLGNPTTVVGVLATRAAQEGDWTSLRSPTSPWRARDHLMAMGRLPLE